MIKGSQLKKSFSHALRGIRVVYRSEQSFRIQVFFGALVLLCGLLFRVSVFEFILLVLLVGSVLVLELINSVFERIVDAFKPRIHPAVKDMKDIMAATVFIASLIAAVVGGIIFLPYLIVLKRIFPLY